MFTKIQYYKLIRRFRVKYKRSRCFETKSKNNYSGIRIYANLSISSLCVRGASCQGQDAKGEPPSCEGGVTTIVRKGPPQTVALARGWLPNKLVKPWYMYTFHLRTYISSIHQGIWNRSVFFIRKVIFVIQFACF